MRRLVYTLALTAACASMAFSQTKTSSRMESIENALISRLAVQEDVWFDNGDFLAAIQLLRSHAELQPQDYDVWTNLGWMLENVQANDEALAIYTKYRRLNPADPDRTLPLAEFLYRSRSYAQVPPLLEPQLSAKAHPNNFRVLAHSYERLGMLIDSQRVWKAYIAREPKDLAAQANLRRVEGKISKLKDKS